MYLTKGTDYVHFHETSDLGDALTKRELFAMQAMRGLIEAGVAESFQMTPAVLCTQAVALADALVVALNLQGA